jgi:HSP20 family protein
MTTPGMLETPMNFGFNPPAEVEETANSYLISFDLPGVSKNDVKVEISDNQLTVSGERKEDRREEQKGRQYTERYYGSFFRTFTLPSHINSDQIEAHFQDGVLRLVLPKHEASQPKSIPISESKPKLDSKREKAA